MIFNNKTRIKKKATLLVLLVSVVVISGCIIDEKIKPETTGKFIMKEFKKNAEKTTNTIKNVTINYTKELNELIQKIENLRIDDFNITDTYVDTALLLSTEIRKLPQIDEATFNSPSKFEKFVTDINKIIEISNENFGTNFRKIEVNNPEFKRLCKDINKIQRYLPLIGPYNRLINSAKKIDRGDLRTVNRFYINLFSFSTDVVLIHNKVFHKLTFTSVGYLNNKLKIAKIRSICGYSCHSFVLTKSYYFININIIQLKESLDVWLAQ